MTWKCLCVFKSGFCVIWKYTLANRLAKSIKSDFGSINWHARLKTSLAPYCLWEGSLVIALCSMPFINWPWNPVCSVTALYSSQKGLVIHKKVLPSSFFPVFSANRSLLRKLFFLLCLLESSLVAQTVKRLPAMRETWVWSLGREDPLEKEMATHSSILSWKIPWTGEPGRLQSMGPQRVGHDWATSLTWILIFLQGPVLCFFTF